MQGKNYLKIFLSVLLLVSVPLGVILVSQRTNFFQRAFGVNADLKINAAQFLTADSPSAWRNFAQGGEEKGRSLLPVTENMKKLRPHYVRVDHIYDHFNVVSGSSGNLAFNWGEFDQYIEDIRAMGGIPFIALTYMPVPISASGDIVGLPGNWADWELVVQKTVEHVSGTLGISNVYYEVWNEPDLFGKFKMYGDKSYVDLYSHSVIGAQRASGVKPFKIGGPATTGLYKNWFDGLMKLKEEGNLRLDFFSWHRYSKKLDDFEEDIRNINSWKQSYPNSQNIELVVTETGINSENDKAYDGNLSAIHTMASNAVYEAAVSKIFNFEIKDGPGNEKFWGRWGMLTHDKFGAPEEKQRFHAIQFMNRMVGNSIEVKGAGSWVKAFARRDGDIVRIMVVNFDTFDSHSEATPIEVTNLPYTKFKVTRYNFNAAPKEEYLVSDTNTWGIVLEFPPNTASILEITPN